MLPGNCGYHPGGAEARWTVPLEYIPQEAIGAERVLLISISYANLARDVSFSFEP